MTSVKVKHTVLNKQDAKIVLDPFSVFVTLDITGMENSVMVRIAIKFFLRQQLFNAKADTSEFHQPLS